MYGWSSSAMASGVSEFVGIVKACELLRRVGLWFPLGRFGDEPRKKSTRSRARVVGSFRMPLHAEDEAAGSSRRIFDRLDNAVLGAACRDAQAIARLVDRLVMAGIYKQGSRFEVRRFERGARFESG